jgi:hypothetical protein
MEELQKEEEKGREVVENVSLPKVRVRPNQAGDGRSRCLLGRVEAEAG